MPPPYALGWDPDAHAAARGRLLAAGRYAQVMATATDVPPAFSLSGCRLRHLEQGQAGTCWLHAGVQLAEVASKAAGLDAHEVCRRLVGWAGKAIDGGGNPAGGGAVSSALAAMSDRDGGYGCAHEALLPYSDDWRELGKRPPQDVFDDAAPRRLTQLIDVKSDDDARRLIAGRHPCANGIWWPFNWDDSETFMDRIGRGSYGHALTEIGYVTKGVWDNYDWFQFDNWHTLLYPPLPADKAAKVPGYKPVTPERTSDFWVRADVYAAVRGYGNAERVSATGLTGWKVVDPPPPGPGPAPPGPTPPPGPGPSPYFDLVQALTDALT